MSEVWYEVHSEVDEADNTNGYRYSLVKCTITDTGWYNSQVIESTSWTDKSDSEICKDYENLQRKRDLLNQVPLAGLIWELRKDGR